MTNVQQTEKPLNMLERVARAICAKTSGTDDDRQWSMFIDAARAAIAAMREPTGGMNSAGQDCEAGTYEEDIPRIYTAMIDAALEGK